jgi:hypothetical protein
MSIKFTCEHCDTELTVRDELAGKAARCPHCKSVITTPRRGGNGASGIRAKNRRDDDDEWEDEDEDDRPRKSKKKSSRRDEDEDEEDDRPSRRKSQGRSRRDEDEDDEDDYEDERGAKKRKARFRFAALGMLLHGIGGLLYSGAFLLAAVGILLLTGSVSSHLGKPVKGSVWRETPQEDEATLRARTEKHNTLAKDFLESRTRTGPLDDSGHRISRGIKIWAGTYNAGVIIVGFLVGFLLLAGLILTVIGLSFTLRAPVRGAAFGMSIATLATAALSLLCFLVVFFILLSSDGGLCGLIPFSLLNPIAGASTALYMEGLAVWIVLAVGALFYLLPLLEVGRMTNFAIYQMIVGKKLRDRSSRSTGFLMTILVPSVILGTGFLVFCVSLAMPSEKSLQEAALAGKTIDIPSPWPTGILLMFNAVILAGLLAWFAIGSFSTKSALRYAK